LTPVSSPLREFLRGLRAELPLLLGVVPFGMIYGVLALSSGLTPAEAQGMSAIVFAGSAQIVAAQLFAGQAPALVIILTIAIVNLRHALYSASVAPHIQCLPARWKVLLAYLLTDEAFAVTILHYQRPNQPEPRHFYFFGAGLTLWSSWQLSTALGIFLGTQIPAGWSLDFTLALTFIALVVPALRDRPSVLAALSAGITAVLTYALLPLKLWLAAAALVGIGVGMLAERRSPDPAHAAAIPERER
jgi:4-azaleucine resistance transporter AzlC